MDLNELIMLGACSILGNEYYNPSSKKAAREAVEIAKAVWEETLRQDREE